MVKSICVASTNKLAGKSLAVLFLALKARSKGRSVGYFKPIGIGSSLDAEGHLVDEDAETMRRILSLKERPDLICPVTLPRDQFLESCPAADARKLADRIVASYRKLSEGKDVVLIEGPDRLWTGSFAGLPSPKVAAMLSARLLLVSAFQDDSTVDDLIHAHDYCKQKGASVAGAILTRISAERMERTKRVIVPYLEARGLSVLGTVPEERKLAALTVRDIHEAIDGTILAGKEGMNRTIQNYLVGAMTMESAMKYFRRAEDELVITGGDRTDIILAAMEAGAAAIVLTGNLQPTIKILPRADDMAIPIILVAHDTFTTLAKVQSTIGKIKPGDEERIAIARELFERNTRVNGIL